MNRVTLCENTYEPQTWKTFDVEDVREFLTERFHEWPKTARIYLDYVAQSHDVTPVDEATVERLETLKGHFYVVVYPEGIELIVAIIAIAVAAVAIGVAFLLRPSVNVKNQHQESPNNSLSDRQNRERPNQRIPDIYGELWSTPDLIEVPYRVFKSNKEYEYCYMCIGRGYYEVVEVRDDTTPVREIDGVSVEIYSPNTSPNSGDPAQLTIGDDINEPVRQIKRSNAVNGQILTVPNGGGSGSFRAYKNATFVSPDSIEITGLVDTRFSFENYFAEGSKVVISNAMAHDPDGIESSVDLGGTYYVASVGPTTLTLANPASVNSNWTALASFGGSASTECSPVIVGTGNGWVGPFVIADPGTNQVWCNFVAPQGLYEIDSKGNQNPLNVTVEIEVMAVDANNYAIGLPNHYTATVVGTSRNKQQCAITLKATLPFTGPCQIRARRVSSTDLRSGYSVVDQIQWRDAYSVTPVSELDFGNVTTLQVVTWPTQDALAIKERKINVLVRRLLPTLSDDGGVTVTVDGKCMPWNVDVTTADYVVDGKCTPWSLTDPNYPFGSGAGGISGVAVDVTPGDSIIVNFVSGSVIGSGGGTPTTDGTGAGSDFRIGGGIKTPAFWVADPVCKGMCLMGAFVDVSENVITPLYIGNGKTLTVPVGATHLQLGFNDNLFFDNTGSVTVSVTQNGLNAAYPYGENDGITGVLVAVVPGHTIKVTKKSGSVSEITGGSSAAITTATLLNGWGSNGHVGDYEAGVDQGHQYPPLGLDAGTTQAFNSPASAYDGSETTAAYKELLHTHAYAGCVWEFVSTLTSLDDIKLRILSEVKASILTVRSAGLYYSIDNGSTWTRIYDASARGKQWDIIALPAGTNPADVQVLAFVDAHDDMGQYIYHIECQTAAGTVAVVSSLLPAFYMTLPLARLDLCAAFVDSGGAVVSTPVAIGDAATFLVPNGADYISLGINDNLFDNNTGSYEVQIYDLDGGTAVTYDPGVLVATKNAADVFMAMSLDPYIGNRTIAELDVVGIYGTVDAVIDYFGTKLAGEFCYTFDDYKVSFEESAADVAEAVFCTAYRRGSLISLFFEKETSNSTLLFCHRNKLPRSEVRSVSFGKLNNFDGIELDYVDPKAPNVPSNDVEVTLYYPKDQSAVSPKKVKIPGIRNNVQAEFHGWRLYNKLLYQNTAVQFDCTQEGAAIIRSERILVADNTRPDTQDGDVLEQIALQLTLSQNITFVGGHTYTMFLQLADGSVQAIAVTAGVNDNQVVLAGPSSIALVTDLAMYARTTYVIVDDANTAPATPFILTEKEPKDGMTYQMKAVNYDARYYAHDGDFIDGTLLENAPANPTETGYETGDSPSVIVVDSTVDNPYADTYTATLDGV